ncbi:MAG: hypothetical protein M3Y03_00935 [Verrucomicrobiota bacterium]|nr:hypothetical protein [Verrucomicrobiota bacterium]
MKTNTIRHCAVIALALMTVGPLQHAAAQSGPQPTSIRMKRVPLLQAWFDEEHALPQRSLQFHFPEATTGPSTWNGGIGNWSDGSMWSPTGAPLTIDAGDSLTINDNSSLLLATGAFVGSGTILNNGNIMLNSGGNLTNIDFTGSSVAFNGTGTITMGGNAANRIPRWRLHDRRRADDSGWRIAWS